MSEQRLGIVIVAEVLRQHGIPNDEALGIAAEIGGALTVEGWSLVATWDRWRWEAADRRLYASGYA